MQIDVGDFDGMAPGVFCLGAGFALSYYQQQIKNKNPQKYFLLKHFRHVRAYLCPNHRMSFKAPGYNQNADL